MCAQINLKQKKKRRAFPGWLIFVAAGVVNGVIILVSVVLSRPEYYIPLPEPQGKIVGGSIAFDGEFFWTARMLVSFGAETSHEIVQFDAEGNVINVFRPERDFRGLAFDGTRLWTADAAGSGNYIMNGKFYTVDMGNGRLVEQFTINRDYFLDGIGASEYRLWVVGRYRVEESGAFLWEIDQYTRTIAHEVTLPAGDLQTCSGITYFKDHIYAVVGIVHKEVLKISTYEGRIIERFDFSGRQINGITNNGNDILVADGEEHKFLTLNDNEP